MSEAKLVPAQGSAPLSTRQNNAYAQIGHDWQKAPRGTLSQTLLALRDRGLIESRLSPGVVPLLAFHDPWHSSSYQWRRRPNK